MKVTKGKLEQLFNEYNKLYFEDKLYYCKLMVVHSTGPVGWYVCDSKTKYGKLCGTIYIATNVDWTEENLHNVLIHEMIHHYVAQIDGHPHCDGYTWYGLFGHGTHFRAQCKRIKRDFGLTIHIHGGPRIYLKEQKAPTTRWGKMIETIGIYLC